MTHDLNNTLLMAKKGDINAFQQLFSEFHQSLKSYLYRLLANRNDAEDLCHDTFIKAFDKISTFKGESSFKTWVFQIATNLAYDYLRKSKRWSLDAQDKAREFAHSHNEVSREFRHVHQTSPYGNYEIKEHIDFCFTCIGKTLLPESQVALILKDIYDFPVNDISIIINVSVGVAKHLLVDARKIMADVFDNRCALISKTGTCHQCSELNGFFNPKQNQQAVIVDLGLTKVSGKYNREHLLDLRLQLIRGIDPLLSSGNELQEAIMSCVHKANEGL